MGSELKFADTSKVAMEWPVHGDPGSQAVLWVPERPYQWQRDVWRACMTRGSRTACVTPNESGKTSLVVPVLGLSFMAAFPGAQVVSTAGVERQIVEGLWPVLKSSLARRPLWKITGDLKIQAPSVNGLPGSTWEAFTTKEPQLAEGFHPRWFSDKNGVPTYCPLMIIVDEAKSFQGQQGEEMIRTFERRCSPDIMLMISTPGEDDGPFYDCFNVNREKWTTFEIGWDDCPHLKRGFKLEERVASIKELGEDHPFNMSWVFGKFYRRGARFVFSNMQMVERCMGNMTRIVRGERACALEYSGGGDEQVFGVRDGNEMVALEAFHISDTEVLADKFAELIRKWKVAPGQVIADDGGLGLAVNYALERRLGAEVQRYNFGAAPRDKRKYMTKATEDIFDLAYLCDQGAIKLPNDAILKEQMRKRRFEMKTDDTNRIRVEPKELVRNRGERSPDRLDVAVMLFSDMPRPEWGAAAAQSLGGPAVKMSRCGTVAGCYQQQQQMEASGSSLFWERD